MQLERWALDWALWVFTELKSHCQMDYVPVTTRVGNPIYLLSAMLLHNLTRELQMIVHPPRRGTTAKRTAPWVFEKLQTMRRNLPQRAGRLLHPGGKLVLSMNDNAAVERELLHYVDALKMAAWGGRIYAPLGFSFKLS